MASDKKRTTAMDGCANKKQRRDDGQTAAGEEKQLEPLVIPPSQITLYRDALQSVFKFLSLRDLCHAMCVARSWHAAVGHMPCAGFQVCCTMERLVRLCSSSLSKHVAGLSATQPLDRTFASLTLRMPQLTSQGCTVLQAAATNVSLPHKLETLMLNLRRLSAAHIDAIIKGASQLQALVTLKIVLPSFLPTISFAPLASVALLRELQLNLASPSQPTEAQVDQLRALPHLRRMAVESLSSQSLSRLLRTPHNLRWQEVHTVQPVDAIASAALSTLPSLQDLTAWRCTDIGFLAHLVQLHTLNLFLEPSPWPATITADALIDGLSSCSQLTDLVLTAPFNCKHLCVLLPRLPLLTALWLWRMCELESLECLSSGPLVHRLRSLRLFGCNHASLHSIELLHLHELHALEELSKMVLGLFTPPSKLIPTLKKFEYTPSVRTVGAGGMDLNTNSTTS